jgi:hypothetical protein
MKPNRVCRFPVLALPHSVMADEINRAASHLEAFDFGSIFFPSFERLALSLRTYVRIKPITSFTRSITSRYPAISYKNILDLVFIYIEPGPLIIRFGPNVNEFGELSAVPCQGWRNS